MTRETKDNWGRRVRARTEVPAKFTAKEERAAGSLWRVLSELGLGPLESLRVLHLLSSAIVRTCRDAGPESEWEYIRTAYRETLVHMRVPYRVTREGLVREPVHVREPEARHTDGEPSR